MSAKPKLAGKPKAAAPAAETIQPAALAPTEKPAGKGKAKADPKKIPTEETKETAKPKARGKGKAKADAAPDTRTEEEKKKEAEAKAEKKKEFIEKVNKAIHELGERGIINPKFIAFAGRDEHAKYAKIFTGMLRTILLHFHAESYTGDDDYTAYPPSEYNLSLNKPAAPKTKPTTTQAAPEPANKISRKPKVISLDESDTEPAEQPTATTATPASSSITEVQKDTDTKTSATTEDKRKNLPTANNASCKGVLGYIIHMFLQNALADINFTDMVAVKSNEFGPVKTVTENDEHSFIRSVFYNIPANKKPRVMLLQSAVAAVQNFDSCIRNINFTMGDYAEISTMITDAETKHPQYYRKRVADYLHNYLKLLAFQVSNQLWTYSSASVTGEHIIAAMLNLDGLGGSVGVLLEQEVLKDNEHFRYFPMFKNICRDAADYSNACWPRAVKPAEDTANTDKKTEDTADKTTKKGKTQTQPAPAPAAEDDADDGDDAAEGDDDDAAEGDDADDAAEGDDEPVVEQTKPKAQIRKKH